jgi:hypothetical protein
MKLLKPTAIALITGTLTLGIIVGVSSPTQADDYETLSITPGFVPDPVVGTGLSGGSRYTADCGYVNRNAPDHILYVEDDFDYLRLYIEASDDVTLLMENEATGETICIDDSDDSLLPEYEGYFQEGTYRVWIGDFVGNSRGTYRYQLYITEFPSDESHDYESFSITRGFMPDPMIGTGISGGPRYVGECGYVDRAHAPDHVLTVRQEFYYLRLFAEADEDITLFIENEATGETVCIDDSNDSRLPEYEAYGLQRGTYNIWIGNYYRDAGGARYQLYITEFDHDGNMVFDPTDTNYRDKARIGW